MALMSIDGDTLQYSNRTEWLRHLNSLSKIVTKYANIAVDDILGARAPSIKPGSNDQFDAILEVT